MQTLYLVSHTHWDREWHEPFQVFRLRLVQCIDKLFDLFANDPAYEKFMLDGQTIVLEDYLEVRPDRKSILRDAVRADKLSIGPWYVLPDEFLVSGEAIIRNLQRGIRLANEFGGAMFIGYIPDPFGHISQIPQILRGFGCSTAVFRRGLADEPTEVWWDAPDGSRVLACYLRDSYDNAAWLKRDDAGFVAGLRRLRDSLAPHAVTPNFLLMNGTDHMEPWNDLSRLLKVAREQMPEAHIVHASLPAYVAQVEQAIAQNNLALQTVRGELRNPKRHHLLPGVLSTRMWIKQRNARAQTLLEKWAEPSSAFAELETGRWTRSVDVGTSGVQPPTSNHQLLNLAWKYLLQNHPHDSICGCSVDVVHAEMASRFDWVEQIAEPIVKDNLGALAARIDTQSMGNRSAIVVFNPTSAPRSDTIKTSIELPGSLEEFAVRDEEGNSLPFQIVEEHVDEYYRNEVAGKGMNTLFAMAQDGHVLGMAIQGAFLTPTVNPILLDVTLTAQGEPNLHVWQQGWSEIQTLLALNPNAIFDVRAHSPAKLTLEFVARDVPGLGYRTFFIAPAPFSKSFITHQTAHVIENEFFHVEPDPTDGTLTITDKATGAIFRGAHRFVDGGDRGDLYNYCPPENDLVITFPATPPSIKAERSATRQSLRIAMTYHLPAQLTDERATRSETTVVENIATTVSLYPGVRRIDFCTQIENRARDHRLRVEFPTPIDSAFANAEQAFDVVQRNLELPANTGDWIEQPRPEAPMQGFVSIDDGQLGVTLAARGLPEYEARKEHPGTVLALTLLRCIDQLSRNDLSTRRGNAGPSKETPGAQEIGTHVFDYAFISHPGDWRNAFARAQAFVTPLRAVATQAHPGTLAPTMSFIEASPSEFVISAIKLAEDGRGFIVRGYNIGTAPILGEIKLWRSFNRATRTNLNEKAIAPIELADGRLAQLPIRAKEIVTIRFE